MPNTGIAAPEGILQERIKNIHRLQRRAISLSYQPCRTPQRAVRSRARRPGLGRESPHRNAPAPAADVASNGGLLRAILRRLRRREKNEAVREAIEELIEETPESDTPISEDQRVLLANILKLRDKTVRDVMVPRVDIVAIAADTPLDEVVRLIQAEAHSRYPVYRESLDDVIGMIHIKDVLAYWGTAKKFNLRDILRRVVFVAPTLPVLDMLLDMRRSRTHMALVVDEFGGTDGLLTIEDLVEEIVGEIEDEHDVAQAPTLSRAGSTARSTSTAARPIEMLEQEIGSVLSEDERREIDTVGGLIFSLLGRIPERGEVVRHPSGVEFEILDVDPRRIRRLRVRPPAVDAVRRLIADTVRDEASGMARAGRWLDRGRARGARHAAAVLAAAGRGRHRGLRLAVGRRADGAHRRAARLGLGHRPFRRRLLLDGRGLLRAAGRLRAARAAGGAGPGRVCWVPFRPRRPGRRKTLALRWPQLAGRYRRLVLLAIAWTVAEWLRGHIFTGYPWNPLGACLGLCHALAAGRGVGRRVRPRHLDLHHPRRRRRPDGARRSPRSRSSGLAGIAGQQVMAPVATATGPIDAHRAAQCAAGGKMAARRPRTRTAAS